MGPLTPTQNRIVAAPHSSHTWVSYTLTGRRCDSQWATTLEKQHATSLFRMTLPQKDNGCVAYTLHPIGQNRTILPAFAGSRRAGGKEANIHVQYACSAGLRCMQQSSAIVSWDKAENKRYIVGVSTNSEARRAMQAPVGPAAINQSL